MYLTGNVWRLTVRDVQSSLIVCLIGLLALITNAARAECISLENCDELWVAAQDIGIPLSFFSKVSPPRDAGNIIIGDTLVSQHNINVRARPEVSSDSLIGRLPIGTQVGVEDLRKESIAGQGTQIWLRITARTGSIQPKSRRATVPAGTAGTEIDDKAKVRPNLTPIAIKIIDCYKTQVSGGKITTIRGVYECSGFWVTPRALLKCSLSETCPALSDTPNGRALLDVTLKADDLNVDSALTLMPKAEVMPRLPETDVINFCNKTKNSSQEDFLRCVTLPMFEKHKAQVDCFKKFTDGEKLACFAEKVGNKDFTALIGCLGGGPPSSDKLALCTSRKDLEQQVSDLRDCVADASTDEGARACISNRLAPEQKTIVNCISRLDTADYARCLDTLSPEMKKTRLITACVEKSSNETTAAQCILSDVSDIGGDTQNIISCLSTSDKVTAAVCILGDTPQTRAVQKAYKCIAGGRDASSVIFSCADDIFPEESSRQTMACIAKAGNNRAKLAGCSAGAILPPEAARIVGCALESSGPTSSGPTSFALCAAGPAMNEEWRIAAECATQSGGNPTAFVACTAGRLTTRELIKCLNGQVGKDCFGPNNTIVVGLKNVYSDLTKGPGENSDIVKAVRSIGELTGGPNSVINNPGQMGGGPNSVFNNPGQILGGENSVFRDPGQVLDPSRWRF